MASTYTAGDATLNVVPSMKGFHRKLESELKGYNPAVEVTADTRAATRDLTKLASQPRRATIQIDVARSNLAKAEAEIAAAEQALTSKRADSADAAKRAEIAEQQLTETRSKSNVKASQISQSELKVSQAHRASSSALNDVRNAEERLLAARGKRSQKQQELFNIGQLGDAVKDVEQLGSAVATVGSIIGGAGVKGAAGLGELAGSASSAAGPIGSLVAVGVTVATIGLAGSFAAAGVIGLANAALQAAGAVALIPGGLAAGGAVAATAYIGFSGVSDALDAVGKASQTAATDSVDSAKRQRAANEQITTAVTAMSRAREDATRNTVQANQRVTDAERQLARTRIDADRSVLAADRQAAEAQTAYERAQRSLRDAIDETTRSQRDLNLQVRGGVLDAEEATLNLATAQEQYNAAVEAGVGGDELKRYEIALGRAKLQVEETTNSNDDLAKQQKEVQKTGVQGARAVQDATEQVAQAQQALADAAQQAAYERTRAEEQVADAVRAVAEAEDARAQTAVQNQRSIQDAQRALNDAYANANDKLDQMSSSAKAAQQALAQLSPEAQDFVRKVQELTPAWNEVKNAIQDALFNGLAEKLQELTNTYFPIMKTRLSDIATAANDAAGELVDLLTDPKNAGSVDKILADTRDIVRELAKAIGPLIEAFLEIASVGTDVLKDVSTDATGAAEAFRDWIHDMKESGKLRDWMEGAVEIIKKIVVLAVNGASALVDIITSLNQGVSDSGFYEDLGQMFKDFLAFVKSDEGKQFMYDLGRTIGDVATWVVKIIEFLAMLMGWWDAIDQVVRDATDGTTGFFELLVRLFLGISTLGLSEVIISLFKVPWDDVGNWFSDGIGGVLTRVALAVATFGLSEVIRAAFNIDWGSLGDWFSSGTGQVFLRVVEAIATFGLSELIRAIFSVDWDSVIGDFTDGIARLGSSISNKIREIPVVGQLFSLAFGDGGVGQRGSTGRLTDFGSALFGHADGGYIVGAGTSTSDSIPALLSNGEFVVNARATARNRGALEMLNAQRFADGGLVGSAPAVTSAAGVPVTIDPAAIGELGVVAAAVTDQLTTLHAELTALVTDVMAYWAQILLTSTQAADGITTRQTLLQQFYAVSWATMQTTVWAATNGQLAAFTALNNGMAGVRASMAQTADWATSQYGRVRAAAADPIRWVLANPFNAGLIAAWNQLDSDFALNKHVNPVPIGFATGGKVRGPGTGTSDSIRALLSDGEFVVRAAITRQALPFLEALNDGRGEALEAAGVRPPAYATGGLVADTGSQLNAAVVRGQAFLHQQAGKPYVWGGVGPAGYDCSGLVSAVTNVLRGEANPYRRLGTAASQPWGGFVPGLSSAFATGFNGQHTALTLGGLNGEAQTFGVPVLVGPRAAGADSAQFTSTASLPLVGGKFIPGGGPGADPAAIMAAAFADTLRQVDTIDQMWPGNLAAAAGGGLVRSGVSSLTGYGTTALQQMLAITSAVAGSPEVVAGVRAVARAFGWGDGAEWDSLSQLVSHESGFNSNAHNPTSSAAGLFQKMTSIHGPLEPDVAGQTRWGLNYIKGTYGDPINAWQKWMSRSPHWYDDGGIASGVGFMMKNTLEPERVLSPAMTRSFDQALAAIGSGQFAPAAGGSGLDGLRGLRISGPVTVNGLDGYIEGVVEDYDHRTGDAIRFGTRP